MIDTIGFALGAGLVAALNPCGFALLPGYLGLVIAGDGQESSRLVALVRAGVATVAMSVGFLTVFGIFGLLILPLIASAQRYLPFATVAVGVLLMVLGVWLVAGKDITVIVPKLSRSAPTAQLRSMFGYGVGYAIASLSCTIGPFLAVISLTFRQGSILTGAVAFVAYAGGMTVTVGVAALAVALAGSAARGALRRILPQVGRIAGVIVLLTAFYVTYYGYYEIRLYFAHGNPDDPIIESAGAVQGWLSRQVDTLGIAPLLAGLAVLVVIAIATGTLTRRADRR
ncbi:hypothetical protein A9W97_17525 [Mycobacterium gordonae]|nr:cytochrome c biogenesis protein CcdA [Mycobacterium gordonae]OBJ87419.1 hypothetical protein A9W97_17525 [Mycobacterium gordonae]